MSEDGYYRLMPIRYECLATELTEEQDDKNTFQSKNLEKDAEEFQILQCSEGNNEKPASFVVVPSSVDDPESFKDAMLAHRENKVLKSNSKNVDQKINKNSKVKNSRKSVNKNTKSKRIKMDTSHSESFSNNVVDEKSNSEIDDCSQFAPHNSSINGKQPNSIVISIAHVDEEGNVIKKEIIKSEEMVI